MMLWVSHFKKGIPPSEGKEPEPGEPLAGTCLLNWAPYAVQLSQQTHTYTKVDPGVQPSKPSPLLHPTSAFLTQEAILNWVIGPDTSPIPSLPSSFSRLLTKEPQPTRKKAKSTHTPLDPTSGGADPGLRDPSLQRALAPQHWRAPEHVLRPGEWGVLPMPRTETQRGALSIWPPPPRLCTGPFVRGSGQAPSPPRSPHSQRMFHGSLERKVGHGISGVLVKPST